MCVCVSVPLQQPAMRRQEMLLLVLIHTGLVCTNILTNLVLPVQTAKKSRGAAFLPHSSLMLGKVLKLPVGAKIRAHASLVPPLLTLCFCEGHTETSVGNYLRKVSRK